MKVPLIIIGGGLSGLAAGVRSSRFVPEILILEKHSRLGGLNSYYYRHKNLFETGLHAITNYAEPRDKKAPLNRLLRQLKIKRELLEICPQKRSEIRFHGTNSLFFSNDFEMLQEEILQKFPQSYPLFEKMLKRLAEVDPYRPAPFTSAKKFLDESLQNPLLSQMLLCPLMYYGSSVENDMDLGQFAIMFQAIFQEGMFRPKGTIKDLLTLIEEKFRVNGGTIRKNAEVVRIIFAGKEARGVELVSGEIIECDHLLSTIGHHETMALTASPRKLPRQDARKGRLGFIETIFQIPTENSSQLPKDRTIIFYNNAEKFRYQQVETTADFASGVICFPQNFVGIEAGKHIEVRSTHLASYDLWLQLYSEGGKREKYLAAKKLVARNSARTLEDLIGKFSQNTVYQDTFTPITIERYTSKIGGAIYGSPDKIKDGDLGFDNLFLAGTDQGFLGIVGSMLSGVSIVNQHILPKL
ncbi:phytoene desaturase family protein [Desulfotalea psychrophila]|uniref:phytoene desaturase family protein n=1 Tax=Desulfotalea psychrophila TaxID=84980 RepID=UPI0002D86807|nr:FAD-dependent oxidoreductase [Desulfotalea psychrophila]